MPHIDRERTSYRKKKDTGNWEVIYYLIDGAIKQRKHKGGFSTRSNASKWLKDYARQIESGELEREQINFTQFKERYLSSLHHKKPGSIMQDRVILNHFEAHLAGKTSQAPPVAKKLLTEITIHDINRFLSNRRDKVSENTLSRDVRTLKTVFNVAVSWNLITINPAANVPRIDPDESEIRYLDLDQQAELYKAAQTHAQKIAHRSSVDAPYIFPIVVLALRTGMRKGEILNLQWKNIDLPRQRIHIENVTRGSNNWRTKSGRIRVVPIDEMCVEAIGWWKDWFAAEILRSINIAKTTGNTQKRENAEYRAELLRQCQASAFVFPTFANPSRPMAQFNKSWDAVRTAAKIDNRFHDLRHTFAVTCAFAGVPIALLSQLLGHSEIETTQKYLRFYRDDAAARVKLPDFRAPRD